MVPVTLSLDPSVVLFYRRVAASAGIPFEQVISDALFRLAGELSLQALNHSDQKS